MKKAKPKKRPTPKRPPARSPARAAKPVRRAQPPSEELTIVREELGEARHELARVATEENHARRDLEAQISAARSTEARLRAELEAVRVEMRTALADLEIARADQLRVETRLNTVLLELGEARESERQAVHATTDATERLRDLTLENQTLRAELKRQKEPLPS